MISIGIRNRVSDSSCALSLSIVISSSVVLFYYLIFYVGWWSRFLFMFIHSYFKAPMIPCLYFLHRFIIWNTYSSYWCFLSRWILIRERYLRSVELLLNIVLMFCKLQIFWTFSVLVLRIWCYTCRVVAILKSVSNAYHLLLTCVQIATYKFDTNS